MKPEFSKPFNIDHAKAGAPFCGADCEAVRVLIWDRKHPTHPIIAIEERGEQEAIAFRVDGKSTSHESLGIVLELVMLPLGLIDGKPVFVGDAIALPSGEVCVVGPVDRPGPDCSWPAPAREYPQTMMKIAELAKHCCDGRSWTEDARAIANAALRHAIDAGQVVTTEDRAVRDMEIARAVLSACKERFDGAKNACCSNEFIITRLSGVHLKAVISTVK